LGLVVSPDGIARGLGLCKSGVHGYLQAVETQNKQNQQQSKNQHNRINSKTINNTTKKQVNHGGADRAPGVTP
jgi:predicted transcriptional regulator